MSAKDELRFYMVVIPESGDPEIHSAAEVVTIAQRLRALPESSRGYVFYGERLDVTSAPWRYLCWSKSAPIPLFDPPRMGKADKSSKLGRADDDAGSQDRLYTQVVEAMLAEDAERDSPEDLSADENQSVPEADPVIGEPVEEDEDEG